MVVTARRASYVVVGLQGGGCDAFPGRDCVAWVQGPFTYQPEASRYAVSLPESLWLHPHVLPLMPPFETEGITGEAGRVVSPDLVDTTGGPAVPLGHELACDHAQPRPRGVPLFLGDQLHLRVNADGCAARLLCRWLARVQRRARG